MLKEGLRRPGVSDLVFDSARPADREAIFSVLTEAGLTTAGIAEDLAHELSFIPLPRTNKKVVGKKRSLRLRVKAVGGPGGKGGKPRGDYSEKTFLTGRNIKDEGCGRCGAAYEP